jgi:perosamine synthetase
MTAAKTAIPRMSAKSKEYVNQVLEFGFHNTTSLGFTGRLEKEFAEKFGVKYAITHCNGTATMHTALMAADVGVGDEVIVPSLTMASTAFVALHVNAMPIFADIDPDTFTIDPKDIERKITPRTRAVIPVSIYGLSPDMDPIMALAKKHNLVVIEDNAQCFLGYYKGRVVGSLGHMASFSFQGSKHMTCGDGGITVTDNPEYAVGIRRAAVLGYANISATPGHSSIPQELRCRPDFARHVAFGYNFRMPEIACAAALGELQRLEELVYMRQENVRILGQVVRDCRWLVPQKTPEGYVHSYYCYTCKMTDEGPDWMAFRKKFVELGGDGFYAPWLPVHREPVFQNLSKMVRENPKRWPQFAGFLPDYRQVHCPVLEKMQPRMIQFKTNCLDVDSAQKQADILDKTIRHFG